MGESSKITVLSLDPSSTAVGWAVMESEHKLIYGGIITPRSLSDGSYIRIAHLRRDLRELLDEVCPDTILIEWTKGKVGKRRHKGYGAGLAVYGCGVGAIATECEIWAANVCLEFGRFITVIPILENDWTRCIHKRDRQVAIASMFDEYKISQDPDGDMADAIGMAVWWFRQKKISHE